jgi:hypothetical protein
MCSQEITARGGNPHAPVIRLARVPREGDERYRNLLWLRAAEIGSYIRLKMVVLGGITLLSSNGWGGPEQGTEWRSGVGAGGMPR